MQQHIQGIHIKNITSKIIPDAIIAIGATTSFQWSKHGGSANSYHMNGIQSFSSGGYSSQIISISFRFSVDTCISIDVIPNKILDFILNV